MELRRQPAGGVGDDDVAATRLARDHRIEGHRRRIAALLADDLHAVAVRPHGELLARRGAEGIRRGQQHVGLGIGQMARELADAGRLAGAVDADHHHHRRRVLTDHQLALQRLQQFGQRVHQQLPHGGRIGGLRVLHATLQVVEQELGRLHAGVGHQQRGFELFIQRVVDLRAGEDLGDARPGLAQPLTELVHPALARCRLGRRRRRRRRRCARSHRAGRGSGSGSGSGSKFRHGHRCRGKCRCTRRRRRNWRGRCDGRRSSGRSGDRSGSRNWRRRRGQGLRDDWRDSRGRRRLGGGRWGRRRKRGL